jgi:hypothetical protein
MMREVSTEEPVGFGISGEDSRRVILVLRKVGREERARAVDTGVS